MKQQRISENQVWLRSDKKLAEMTVDCGGAVTIVIIYELIEDIYDLADTRFFKFILYLERSKKYSNLLEFSQSQPTDQNRKKTYIQ